MNFNIFNSSGDIKCITAETLVDCKIPQILDLVFDKDEVSVNRFMKFLQGPAAKSEIIERQNFFREIFFQERKRDFIKIIQTSFLGFEKYLHLYQKETDPVLCNYLFYSMIKEYLIFLGKLRALIDQEDDKAESEIMKKLLDSIETMVCSKEAEDLAKEAARIGKDLDNYKAINLDLKISGADLKSCSINNFSKNTLIDRLSGLLKNMGMEIDFNESTLGQNLSVKNEYIKLILLWDEKLLHMLEEFYHLYKDYADRFHGLNIEDIHITLDCIRLFELISKFGIPLTRPEIADQNVINICRGFDISLLIQGVSRIVPNDFLFSDKERIQFLAGANGGGKTSYIRTLGICAVFASAGLLIPAESAILPLFDHIVTQFSQKEDFDNDGRFINERNSVFNRSASLTINSLFLSNELFSSTDEDTAFIEYERLTRQLEASRCYTIMVTHFNKVINYYSDKNEYVMLTATVNDNRKERTFVISRSGYKKSYVYDILEKYSLTKENLMHRVRS